MRFPPLQRGDVIAIMNQYANMENRKRINTSDQLEIFWNDVRNKLLKISGDLQRIKTPDKQK